jgi:hypothetical protein
MRSKSKQLVYFDKKQFDAHQNKYKKSLQVEAEIKKEVQQLLPDCTNEIDFSNVMEWYFNQLEQNPNNIYNLKGVNIAEMSRTDLTKLKELVKQYEPTTAPSISNYSEYAETPSEILRVEALQNLVKAYTDFCEVDNGGLDVLGLVKSIPYRCTVDLETKTLTPQLEWMRTGNIRIYY